MNITDLGELYAGRYDDNLRAAQAEIERYLKRLAINNDGTSDFAEYLEAQRGEIENYINVKYDTAYKKSMEGAYTEGIKIAQGTAGATGVFSTVAAETYKSIARNQVVWFEVANAQAAREVMDSLMSWALSGDRDTLAITKMMDDEKLARYGKTIVQNHVTTFAQTVVSNNATERGVRRFRYVGPVPRRPFCDSVMSAQGSRGYTIAEINAMDNGQGGSVMLTRGGYGCRHAWQAIADSIGEEWDDRNMDELEERLKKRGVIYSDKPQVYIRDSKGDIINKMSRAVKKDDEGFFYKRFDGTRQPVIKAGQQFIFQAAI
jgi:hypothetical protein